MTDTQNELKPCPFCGGDAIFEECDGVIHGEVRWSVGCDKDEEGRCFGYQSLNTYATKGEAQRSWNTRAIEANPDTQKALDALSRVDETLSFIRNALNEPDELTLFNLPSIKADLDGMIRDLRTHGVTIRAALEAKAVDKPDHIEHEGKMYSMEKQHSWGKDKPDHTELLREALAAIEHLRAHNLTPSSTDDFADNIITKINTVLGKETQ